MVASTKLLEREGRSAVLDYTSSLICARRKDGTFSLQLVESSDIGELRHPVAKRIRTPKGFIDAVMSLTEWTDLELDYDMIVDEICEPLSKLDTEFATAVVELVVEAQGGEPARLKAVRA